MHIYWDTIPQKNKTPTNLEGLSPMAVKPHYLWIMYSTHQILVLTKDETITKFRGNF